MVPKEDLRSRACNGMKQELAPRANVFAPEANFRLAGSQVCD
jgi:hypothetical protein